MIAIDEITDIDSIQVELAERHLKHFVRQAWHILEPGNEYKHNWHIDAICEHLEAALRGDIRNLLINVPPRSMKTLIVSVFFPAWAWTKNPQLRFLYASYAQTLSDEHSGFCRDVIESDWYQKRWGHLFQLSDDDNLRRRFSNTQRGQRIATSVGAAVTGFGGDIIVADDPHNVKQAESELVRQTAVDWWNRSMATRINNPATGVRIVVMQRVHEEDVAGSCIAKGTYTHLSIPMEYEGPQQPTSIGWTDPRQLQGQLMWPEHIDEQKVAELKKDLGSYAYAGQMQQRPAPASGGMFKRSWWKTYNGLPELDKAEVYVDSAFKDGVENDYSVFALWGKDSTESVYLINVWRARVQFPELIRLGHDAMAWSAKMYPKLRIPLVVEDKASGQSAIQTWSRPYYTKDGVLPKLSVIPFKVDGTQTKTARADGVTAIVEGGRAYVPNTAGWLDEWLLEHQSFPMGAHDDQVDTTSMALTRLTLGKRRGGWAG